MYQEIQKHLFITSCKRIVYQLLNRGEIVAKKFGKVYRIPASSLSFMFTGLDFDPYKVEEVDKQNLDLINKTLKSVRKSRERCKCCDRCKDC